MMHLCYIINIIAADVLVTKDPNNWEIETLFVEIFWPRDQESLPSNAPVKQGINHTLDIVYIKRHHNNLCIIWWQNNEPNSE